MRPFGTGLNSCVHSPFSIFNSQFGNQSPIDSPSALCLLHQFAIGRNGFQLACDLGQRNRHDMVILQRNHIAELFLQDKLGCRYAKPALSAHGRPGRGAPPRW